MANFDKKFQDALKLYRQGSLDEAAVILSAQLKKKPKNPNFLHLLGTILSAQGEKQKANKVFRNALKLKPNDTAILDSLANNLLEQQQYSESKELYLRRLKSDSRQWQTRVQLGVVCRFLKESSEAELYFEQALDLNPASTDALINLIHIRLNNRKLSLVPDMASMIETMTQRCIKNSQTAELAMLV